MKMPIVKKKLDKAAGNRATYIEIATVAALVVGFALSIFMPQSLRFGLWLMPFWVLIIIVFAQQKGLLSKFLSKRPLVFLGEISFSFYMIHFLVIRYLAELQLHNVAMVILSLVMAIALSAVLYLAYEEPLRIRLKQFLESKLISRLPRKNSPNKQPV